MTNRPKKLVLVLTIALLIAGVFALWRFVVEREPV